VPTPVRVVHLVAKAHLDLGFTGLAAEVTDRYVDDFFPRAIAMAAELRASRSAERLVWTTGSWVLHHALGAGSPTQRNAVAVAVRRGDLAWHALPLTTHTELMDADLVRAGLGISAELDARFGRATTAAKMTDVPGHTRGLVPLLVEAGVTFLHLGVNPAWPVPEVPPVFRWQAPDGSEVVVAYQAGGYGGEVVVPGCDEALAFLHAGDNLGPPNVAEVVDAHQALAERYPGAEVRGSTLDAFARALAGSGAASGLPVVTAEIGDPWIFGAASDPQKVAAYRDLLARRRDLPAGDRPSTTAALGGTGIVGDAMARTVADRAAADRNAVDRTLLLAAEHTWGLDQKESLTGTDRWDRAGLDRVRATPEGRRFERSWAEQRAYVDEAADLLWRALETVGEQPSNRVVDDDPRAPIPLGRAGHVEMMAAGVPRWPIGVDGVPLGGFVALAPGEAVEGGGWQLAVDPRTGALEQLVDLAGQRHLAGPGHLLGLLTYQSFDEADYDRFYADLSPAPDDHWWARLDNTKPGIGTAGAVSATWAPTVTGTWYARQRAWHTVLVRLAFPGAPSHRLGAPPEAWKRWSWREAAEEVDLDLWWEDKGANRLPEATWCTFRPRVAEPERWTLDKLGQAVSPLDVVRRGGRSLHAVGEGMTYDGLDGPLQIRTVDAPLVAPGGPNLLDADPPPPDLAAGFAVLLHDNCWGTNFPMWSEGPARFRFTISVS